MTVSIIVPTWQRAAWLDRCLAGIAVQRPAPDEVVVVGRAEDPLARTVVERWRGPARFPVRWVAVDRPGHLPPVRRGLEDATGDIVAFVDDDAEPQPGWLPALLGAFDAADVACVGGRVVTPGSHGRVRHDAGRVRWYGRHIGNLGAFDPGRRIEVDGVMEGNWAWRAAVLRALAFDPVFEFDDGSMYGLDLCLQAKRRGYRVVYEPLARVVHHAAPRDPSLDRADRPKRTLAYSRNYTHLALKHLRGRRRAAFVAWWWLVGERGSYGVAKAAADLLARRDGTWSLVVAGLQGKREGVRQWRAPTR